MSGTRRYHHMPFGAEIQNDGRVRFRLWAPAARKVEVCVDHHVLPMKNESDGWFELTSDAASAGSLYRFRIDDDAQVPDPASRFQPQDVHGPSEVINPAAWQWRDGDWRGRPWEEAVIYELHVGSFTPQGDFAAVQAKLDYLLDLGITAIELMPVADFPGTRNWGYDGAYLFAPDSQYGRPDDLKALVEAAHVRGLMIFLDVVYNHFGPEGNYLHLYAPWFFTRRHLTPWGAAINFDNHQSHWVRQFFIHNALYWLEEYHLDGLRFDAVHAITDDSQPDILSEMAKRVRDYFGPARQIHLILENDHNAAHYLKRDSASRPSCYTAQWNDDLHHALHVLLSGETQGYYMDYADDPLRYLRRCLTEGFAYQGERSAFRQHQPRGEDSSHLPPTAFVTFLQNHDQVGNRAFGERIASLIRPQQRRAAMTLVLLAPPPPLIFMGEEWDCRQPFTFFCDLEPGLAEKVMAGRQLAFADFEHIPDPMNSHTFRQSILDWRSCEHQAHRVWLHFYRELLGLRNREIVPRLPPIHDEHPVGTQIDTAAFTVHWRLADDSILTLLANLGEKSSTKISPPVENILYAVFGEHDKSIPPDSLPPWSVIWTLHKPENGI